MKYTKLLKAISGLIIIIGLALSAVAAGVLAKIVIKLFLLGFNSIGGAI